MIYLGTAGASLLLLLGLVALSRKPGSVVHNTFFQSRRNSWLLVVGCGFLFRLLYFVLNPAHDDSLIYVTRARQILAGSPEITPHIGVELVMAVFILLFGPVGASVASLVFAVLTIPLIGAAATELFDSERVGLCAGLAFAVTPIHIYYSAFAITEGISLFFLVLGVVLVLREEYLASTVVGAAIFFMRVEYALFVLLPFLLLQLGNDRRIDYLVGVGPIASFLFVFVSRYATPRLYQQSIYPLLRSLGWSLPFSFAPMNRFLLDPISHVAPRILFYVAHLTHWGVPYWEPALVNPLLAVFAFVGLYRLVSASQAASGLFSFSAIATVMAVVFRETLSPSPVLGLLLLVVFAVTTVAFTCTREWTTPTSRRLFLATVPFWGVLSVFYFATRYLLPLLAIYSVYSGYGLLITLDRLSEPEGTSPEHE